MSEWKKVMLYAMVPALIAGLFAVAPKIYEVLTEEKAILQYSVTRGPAIKNDHIYKSIFAIEVINSGKKPLSQIYILIKTKGTIEAMDVFEKSGLAPLISRNPETSIKVEVLHPTEAFTVSIMLNSENAEETLDVVLRSKEVLGEHLSPIDPKKTKSSFWSALLSAFSVFLMAIYFLTKSSANGTFSTLKYKPDIIYYLAARFGFKDILISYGINNGSVTYLRFSDMLLGIAQSERSEKAKVISCLKCLLLVKTISETSRAQIIGNIKLLESDDFSQNEIDLIIERAEEISEIKKIKENIEEFIINSSAFLTNPTSNSNA